MSNKTNIIRRLKSLIKALKQDDRESFRLARDSKEILANDLENILADKERLEKENKQSVSYQTLCDYLINSVDETQEPIWTKAHIEELLNNFIIKWKDKDNLSYAKDLTIAEAKANKYDSLVEDMKRKIKVLEIEEDDNYTNNKKTIAILQELLDTESEENL